MKKSILLVALMLVAFVAAPAAASVQNVKISGSVDNTYLYREDFDLGVNPGNDDIQSLFLSQVTLQVDADLTDQVATTIGLITERAWEADAGSNSPVDLYLAYVTLREMLYSPLTLVIGRQVFSYGNSFIFDATGANNVAPSDSHLSAIAADLTKQTAIDAVRAILDYNPLTIDLVYSTLHPNTTAAASDADDDKILFGINANYQLGDDMDSVVEAYFWKQVDKSTSTLGTAAGNKADTIHVKGLRGSTNILDGLNIHGEVAWQRGNKVFTGGTPRNQDREAKAAQFIANYSLPGFEEYDPVLTYAFTHVSGDADPVNGLNDSGQVSSEKWTAWDPFFEAQGGGTIYNTLFNLSNSVIHTVSLTGNPMEDVTATATWTGIWLDKDSQCGGSSTECSTYLTLVQPDATSPTPTVKDGENEVGYELDLDFAYDYTEDVQIGASFGWFFAGDLFTSVNDDTARQALLNVNVIF